MVIILKNVVTSTLNIQDLGLRISSNTETELDPSEMSAIGASEDLKDYITSGAIIVNNGVEDLSISEALGYITSKPDLSAYYTKSEADLLLDEKSNTSHLHDSRYYTEVEVDTKLANLSTFGIKGAVDTFANLPSGEEGDVYIVRQNDGANDEGFYRHNGGEWMWLSHNTGATSHNELSNLNTGDYQHLTENQLQQLTTEVDTTLHSHDSTYYTEGEVDSLLGEKSNIGHLHTEYYTKTQVDNLIDSIDYARVSSNDTNTNITGAELEQLTNGSNASGLHNHGDDDDDDDDDDGGGWLWWAGGLDNAYDSHSNWSHGQGREINVDFGPVSLNASNGFAPLRLEEINYTPNQWLDTGQICVYDSELFIYDATRSCWNSVSGYYIGGGFNSNNIKNTYLKGYNGTSFTDDVGWVAPWDGVVVSLAASSNDENHQAVELRKNGNTTSAKIWYSGEKKTWANWIDVKFNEGDVLNFYIDGNNNHCDRPQVWAIIKRRI